MGRVDAQIPKGVCALAVMTKAPRAGEVKTRLSPPLTLKEAAALSTCFLRDTAAAIATIAVNNIARGVAVYTPEDAENIYSEILPPGFLLVPQRGEAFGERLIHALEDLFRLGFSSVCLIDSDSPTLPQRTLSEAATILEQPEDTVVLGPSDDGGYYLVGLKKVHRTLFKDITWSSKRVLQQTVEQAGRINIKLHFLPVWYDVDDYTTLRRLCDEFFGSAKSTAPGYPAPATRGYLEGLLRREGRARIWPDEAKR
jgi:rSAM/selenodomain-associated transferase 1